jgi:hypothetical protein
MPDSAGSRGHPTGLFRARSTFMHSKEGTASGRCVCGGIGGYIGWSGTRSSSLRFALDLRRTGISPPSEPSSAREPKRIFRGPPATLASIPRRKSSSESRRARHSPHAGTKERGVRHAARSWAPRVGARLSVERHLAESCQSSSRSPLDLGTDLGSPPGRPGALDAGGRRGETSSSGPRFSASRFAPPRSRSRPDSRS